MWLWIFGIVLLLIAIFFWGVRRLNRSMAEVQAAISKVTLPDVKRLSDECQRVVLEKFSERLSLNDLEDSARILSSRIDNGTLKQAFSKDEFWWYFVLPVGAYLGELMRTHAKAEWKLSEEGGVEMSLPVKDGAATIFPFEKILKQARAGDKGDLYAYIKTAVALDAVLDKLPPDA